MFLVTLLLQEPNWLRNPGAVFGGLLAVLIAVIICIGLYILGFVIIAMLCIGRSRSRLRNILGVVLMAAYLLAGLGYVASTFGVFDRANFQKRLAAFDYQPYPEGEKAYATETNAYYSLPTSVTSQQILEYHEDFAENRGYECYWGHSGFASEVSSECDKLLVFDAVADSILEVNTCNPYGTGNGYGIMVLTEVSIRKTLLDSAGQPCSYVLWWRDRFDPGRFD